MATSKKKKNQTQNSDHHKWEIIFKALQQMLQKQSLKLESLLQDRDLLQQRILWQRQSWSFDNNLFQHALSLAQRKLLTYELEKSCVVAKAEFQVSSKHRDSVLNKLKFDHTQCDLDDLKAWFDILSHKCPGKEVGSPEMLSEFLKTKSGSRTSKNKPDHESNLEKEVALLKRENEKHKADLFALQDKYNFIWNQFEIKNDEINRANEKVLNLVKSMEELQSASKEKEETVKTLRTDIADMEAEVNKKNGEISRLEKELELIKLKNVDGLNEPSTSGSKGKTRSGNGKKNLGVEKDAKIVELETKLNEKNEEISTLENEVRLLRSKSCSNGTIYGSRGRGNNVRGGKTVSKEDEESFAKLEATIETLKVKISELEAEKSQKDGEILASSNKLKLGFESASGTPSLKRCSTRPPSSRSRGNRNGEYNGASLREENSTGPISEQGCRRSKRIREIDVGKETPKLFTSQFKIPKLRSPSPLSR